MCNCTDSMTLCLLNEAEIYCDQLEYDCLNAVWRDVYQSPDFIVEKCLPKCPLECNLTEYNAKISFLTLTGADFYASLINDNQNLTADFPTGSVCGEKAMQSVVAVRIFYESLSYTLSTESPQMDLVALLANIGGNLGLFLGVSVFSLCELVELAMEIYFIKTNSPILPY